MSGEEGSASEGPGRWFAALGTPGLRRPWLVVAVAALALVVSGWVAWTLPVSTSRYDLVSSDNPFQKRLLRFFDRFGYPDALVLVVTDGAPAERRAVVDSLLRRLEAHPDLGGRVLGKIGPAELAEVLLPWKPEIVKRARDALGQGRSLGRALEGGVPSWIGLVEEQMSAGLDGAREGAEADAATRERQAEAGLGLLATLLRALDARVRGEEADLGSLAAALGESADAPPGTSVDEQGYLVGAGGRLHVVALFPRLASVDGRHTQPIVDAVRSIAGEVTRPPVRVHLTGFPALVSDELVIVKRGLGTTTVAAGAGILFLLLLGFRSLRFALLALVPLGVGTLVTFALVRPLFGGLNLITSSFVSMLLGLGIDFACYVLARYAELLPRSSHEPAFRGAVARTSVGLLVAAGSTALAFLTITTTEFTAYSELGLITAVGLAALLLVTWVVLPAVVTLGSRAEDLRVPGLPGSGHLPGFVRRARWPLVVGAVALVGIGLGRVGRLHFNFRYFDFLPATAESVVGLRLIENDGSLNPVQAGSGRDDVEEARELAARLRKLPSVATVQTATDLLPRLDETRLAALRAAFAGLDRDPDFAALRGRARASGELEAPLGKLADALDEVAFALRQAGRSTQRAVEAQQAAGALLRRVREQPEATAAALGRIEAEAADLMERAWRTGRRVAERGRYAPEDLPSAFRARFSSRDGQALAVYAVPAGDPWLPAVARRFREEVESVDPEMAGLAVEIHDHARMIIQGFRRAAVASAALVALVLLLAFRRVGDGLLAALPLALGLASLFGAMGWLGLDFNVSNVIVPALVLGVGINYGANIMQRWRQSAAENGGVASLDEMLRGTGAGVMLASLTTLVGFAALILGEYGAMKSFGLAMTIGVGACLLNAILVLPAVLTLLGKAR
jgi:predicted RND superfamily exporter protein